MRHERGQASVEWVGLVLLVALGLVALVRLSARPEPAELGDAMLGAMTCAARDGCAGEARRRPATRTPSPSVTPPPLVPVVPGERRRSRLGRARLPRLDPGPVRRVRGVAGTAWRRAWVACFAYERIRYGLLHPESRLPGHRIPPAEALRMVDDCLSPAELLRDLEQLGSR